MKKIKKIKKVLEQVLLDGEITKLEEKAFERACLEAEFLGIEKRGEQFERLCRSARKHYYQMAYYAVLNHLKKRIAVDIELDFPTRAQMVKVVFERYFKL